MRNQCSILLDQNERRRSSGMGWSISETLSTELQMVLLVFC